MTRWIVDLGRIGALHESAPWIEKVLKALYLFMPNLHNFNVRQDAVHAAGVGSGSAVSTHEMICIMLYGVSYASALVLAAILVIRRRNF
jgi:hypothetical protein